MSWTVLGQVSQIGVLKRSIESNRVSHAYLFSGPDGVGKTLLARNFIAALNCETPQNAPCGECRSCKRIAKGTHPDVHWVVPDGATVKIGQVRTLQKELSLHPYEGRYKVGVIEPADKMTIEAANSLLKTLEEPEGNAVLILISPNPQTLLPTIRSRCMSLVLERLPQDTIASHLAQNGVESARAEVVAALSNGSLGWALQATEGEFMALRKQVFGSLIKLKSKDTNELLKMTERISSDKDTAERTIEMAKSWFSDLLMGKIGDGVKIVNTDFLNELKAEERSFATTEVLDALDAIEDTLAALRGNINTHVAVDVLFLRLAGHLRTVH